jgi:hypothetical protein
MAVELVWSAIRRQGREQSHVQLLLKAKGDPARLAEILWRTAEEVLVPGEQDTIANGGYQIKAGPVLVVDHELVSSAEATQWYEDLAARLEEQGISGKLTAAPHTPPPRWVLDVPYDPRPHTHLLYSVDPTLEKRRVAPAVLHDIAAAASGWLQTPGGYGYLSANGPAFLFDPANDMTAMLDPLMARPGVCLPWAGLSEPLRVKEALLEPTPAMGMSIWHPGLAWSELIDQLREPLLWHPHLLDYGFVRTTRGLWPGQMASDYPLPYDNSGASPFVWERQYRALADRLAYNAVVVPDAHGIQILTGAHVAKAHNLSRWSITEVAPDRYLVEAADLSGWYAHPLPNPVTLAQARTDFGDMIITRKNIDEYPLLKGHLT